MSGRNFADGGLIIGGTGDPVPPVEPGERVIRRDGSVWELVEVKFRTWKRISTPEQERAQRLAAGALLNQINEPKGTQ